MIGVKEWRSWTHFKWLFKEALLQTMCSVHGHSPSHLWGNRWDQYGHSTNTFPFTQGNMGWVRLNICCGPKAQLWGYPRKLFWGYFATWFGWILMNLGLMDHILNGLDNKALLPSLIRNEPTKLFRNSQAITNHPENLSGISILQKSLQLRTKPLRNRWLQNWDSSEI